MDTFVDLSLEKKIAMFNGEFSEFIENSKLMVQYLLAKSDFEEELLENEISVQMPEILRLVYSLSGVPSSSIESKQGGSLDAICLRRETVEKINQKLSTDYSSLLLLRKKTKERVMMVVYDPNTGNPIQLDTRTRNYLISNG